jgi:hypothetical protein
MIRPIAIAFYCQKDWERFLQMIDDKKRMHKTWEEWHKAFEKAKDQFEEQGLTVHTVIVDNDELDHYCKIRGIKNNGKARSTFVLNK